MINAEDLFRAAFERLKAGTPQLLPHGTSVSQNNIAKEAGCDPSALRKSRYPLLIEEIQRFTCKRNPKRLTASTQATQDLIKARERIAELITERDKVLSLLVQADQLILDLMQRLNREEPTQQSAQIIDLQRNRLPRR